VPEDYVVQREGPDGAPAEVRLSELFSPGRDALVVSSFMFPRHPTTTAQTALPLVEAPCPSCTALLDQLDGAGCGCGPRPAPATRATTTALTPTAWPSRC
jgi:predicted dithiol-disulfide oxidoreductase (DUF899 family)